MRGALVVLSDSVMWCMITPPHGARCQEFATCLGGAALAAPGYTRPQPCRSALPRRVSVSACMHAQRDLARISFTSPAQLARPPPHGAAAAKHAALTAAGTLSPLRTCHRTGLSLVCILPSQYACGPSTCLGCLGWTRSAATGSAPVPREAARGCSSSTTKRTASLTGVPQAQTRTLAGAG